MKRYLYTVSQKRKIIRQGRSGEERPYAECRYCGRVWNVSIYQAIPARGYVCPDCSGKE